MQQPQLMECKSRQLQSYQKYYFVFTKVVLKSRFAIFCSFFLICLGQIYLHNSTLLLKLERIFLSLIEINLSRDIFY